MRALVSFVALVLFGISPLSAEGFGITLGANSAAAQKIELVQPEARTAFYAGLSYQYKWLEAGVSYQAKAKSKILTDGEAFGDKYSWGYFDVNASLVVPLFVRERSAHSFLLGAALRFEKAEYLWEAEDDTWQVTDKASRLWIKTGYRYTVKGETMQTEIFMGAAFAKKASYDPEKEYTEQQSLRLYAPSTELLMSVTFRF